MSPIRTYRCPDKHELEIMESMDGPKVTRCPYCGKPTERIIAPTSRPIVRDGTPTHHN